MKRQSRVRERETEKKRERNTQKKKKIRTGPMQNHNQGRNDDTADPGLLAARAKKQMARHTSSNRPMPSRCKIDRGKISKKADNSASAKTRMETERMQRFQIATRNWKKR